MYLSLIITFFLLLGIIITSLQNGTPLELKSIIWDLRMSSTALILYFSLIGVAIVAVLALPKLVRKSFDVRSLNRKVYNLKKHCGVGKKTCRRILVRITEKEDYQMKSAMFVKGLSAIMLMSALAALPGCGEKEQTQSRPATVLSKEDVKNEAKEAYDATKAYTQEQMQAFREQTEARLAEYEQEIDQLQAKAEKLEGDAKAKAEQQLTQLRQKRDAVSEKLKELSSSSGNAWEQIKSGIDAAMEDLGNAYKKAAAEFGKS